MEQSDQITFAIKTIPADQVNDMLSIILFLCIIAGAVILAIINQTSIVKWIFTKSKDVFNQGTLELITLGGYYRIRKGNPFHADVVKVLNVKDGYVRASYMRSSTEGSKLDLYMKVDKFNLKFKHDKEYNEYTDLYADDIIKPRMDIGEYNIYCINEFWYIIPKGVDFDNDFSLYPKYKALSIGLFENDL